MGLALGKEHGFHLYLLLQLFLSGRGAILTSGCAPSSVCLAVNPLGALVPASWNGLLLQSRGQTGARRWTSWAVEAMPGSARGTPLWDKGISDKLSLLSGEELTRLLRLTRLS